MLKVGLVCITMTFVLSLRLLSCFPVSSLDSVYLLATCYYRSGRVQQAKHLLSKCRDWGSSPNISQCNLLYARCCLDLKEYVTCIY